MSRLCLGGPVVAQPILSMSDVDNLPVLDADIDEVIAGIGIIIENLTPSQALIGFAGAPFTLASYLVEGGPSRNHEKTKAMMEDGIARALVDLGVLVAQIGRAHV